VCGRWLSFPACNKHTIYCHVCLVWLYHNFPRHLINYAIFGKKLLSITRVIWYSLQTLSGTFLILSSERNIWYDMIWYDMIWYMIYDMIWYDMIWYDMIWYDMIWYDMMYLTAIVLTPGGSSTVHIYKQYIEQHNWHKQYIEQHNRHKQYKEQHNSLI